MSKTFKEKKLHQSQIQKLKNLEEKKIKQAHENELKEAAMWHDPMPITKANTKKERDVEKQKKKDELNRKYEEEYNLL